MYNGLWPVLAVRKKKYIWVPLPTYSNWWTHHSYFSLQNRADRMWIGTQQGTAFEYFCKHLVNSCTVWYGNHLGLLLTSRCVEAALHKNTTFSYRCPCRNALWKGLIAIHSYIHLKKQPVAAKSTKYTSIRYDKCKFHQQKTHIPYTHSQLFLKPCLYVRAD